MHRDTRFELIVLTLAGAPNADLAIAGSRAGAVGVLNLEFADSGASVDRELDRLLRYGRGQLGVLVDGASAALLETILARADSRLDAVLVTATSPKDLERAFSLIRPRGARCLVVATSLDEAFLARSAGADGLVAKGHEAGGWVGDETTFVLLQRLVGKVDLPIYAWGGIGLHTAAAAYVGGAVGAVIDSPLLLARESPLSHDARARLDRLDGSETRVLGSSFGAGFRAFVRPNFPVLDDARRLELQLEASGDASARSDWRSAVRAMVDWQNPERSLLAIGQDAAFAPAWSRAQPTVGGMLTAFREALRESVAVAARQNVLGEGSPLAETHGTRYPIVQGPMTRVSDQAEFASAVAENGALPFLALALMRAPEVRSLLSETALRLGNRPWGVGVLGFVPLALRVEQLEVIREVHPPFALIAGGRPDQAKTLESEGIPTYLHVPSPGLLRMFLQEGARRFVFEGRECGGHVGPRSSFVLWETMIEVLLEAVPARAAADYHVLFAGGIHDATSSAMLAALAAKLAERGVRVGVLMGTAYIFTSEAVRAGAIVEDFQNAAVRCDRTVLLESGPGHATRCVPSPFGDDFEREKQRLLRARLPAEEVRAHLEDLNVGRLRIASKGLDRNPRFAEDAREPKLRAVDRDEQWARGMYMIGQIAALRDRVVPMADLHHEVSTGSGLRLATTAPLAPTREPAGPPPASVAVVGMACIVPGANDLRTYWENILKKVDAITEVPADRFDWNRYFDTDPAAKDKVYSRWGGFVDEIPFDPIEYGMPPGAMRSIEPFQLLALAVVRKALEDAGLRERAWDRERASVILGAGGGAGDLISGYMVRSSLAQLFGDAAPDLAERLDGVLPEWTEDSFPGVLMNVAAGRVANRFDLGGLNYTIDAACASSLAAVYHGVRELENGSSDVAVVGGIDAIQNAFAFLAFSKTHALSPTGRCKTFDAGADGIAISEGFAVVVLKRLADAERDGDRVYAVIRGVGGSSDGRDRSLTAPRPEGQVRALRRAYEHADISPATVGLIEAHGTGTVAGDKAEVQSLSQFFGQSGALRQRAAIGSVKSMIGHTKAAAGVAGLIKVALALHHQVLPPTLNVATPNPKANFPESPFYVNTEPRPWIRGSDAHPRRAGVSAFGFGGTNFHVVLEEYTGAYLSDRRAGIDEWPAELFIWRDETRTGLIETLADLHEKLEGGACPRLADLSYSVCRQAGPADHSKQTLAIVATSQPDLRDKLASAIGALKNGEDRRHDPQGVHYANAPLAASGQVAFLFPGQGSQYVQMGRELAVLLPEARDAYETADRCLGDLLPQPLSRFVFPPPSFTKEEQAKQLAALTDTQIAQPAIGAASLSILRVLNELKLAPDMVAGHSYGELVALHAAGCFDEETLLRLSEARGRFINEGLNDESGTMAAVDASAEFLQSLLEGLDVTLANLNAPWQTVISGTREGVEAALARCAAQSVPARPLQVACAFHSPLVSPAQRRLAALLRETRVSSPRLAVYSNTTGTAYPSNPEDVVDLLGIHLARPVQFVREIDAMYADGARIFVEVGPKRVLGGLVKRIIGNRPHLAVSLDHPDRPAIAQLLNGLAAVAAEGVGFEVDFLHRGRALRQLDLSFLKSDSAEPSYTPTTWLVDGGRSRPASDRSNPLDRLPLQVSFGARKAETVGREADEPAGPALAQVTEPIISTGAPASQRLAPVPEPARRDHAVPDARAQDDTKAGLPMGQSVINSQPEVATSTPPLVYPRAVPASADVLQRFQDVMQQFLETQRSVMLAYLRAPQPSAGSSVRSDGPSPVAPRPLPRPPSRVTNGHYTEPPASRLAVDAELSSGPRPLAPAPPLVPTGQPRIAPVVPVARTASAVPPTKGNGPTPPRARLSPDALKDQLLALVAERTGYPVEMLALDADLEADLGIDSIKRVEIVGSLVRSLTLPPDQTPDLEALTNSRTLRILLDNLAPVVSTLARLATAGAEGDQRPFEPAPAGAGVGRFTLRLTAAPSAGPRGGLDPSGVVLVTDDETGIAETLVEELGRRGYATLKLRVAGGPTDLDAAPLADPEGVSRVATELHRDGRHVAAVVHLAPLRPGSSDLGLDLSAWRQRLATDLRGFFLLVQSLRPDLEIAANRGGAAILAATALGGAFGSDAGATDFFPGHGGLTGFAKALATEYPNVRVKALDFGPDEPSRVAARVLDELDAADGLVEIAFRDGERVVLRHVPAPLPAEPRRLPVDHDSVVLVTGGARGITAEVAVRLAERARPTLVLVGRSPLPSPVEEPDTRDLNEASALKRAILARRTVAGSEVSPALIERDYRGLLNEREIRQNLRRLQEAGATVEYHSCDVRDADAFGRLIDDVYATHHRIDGVIQGAGVIEDKLVRDKKLDSFDRVVGTKVDSAVTLAAKLRPESLRFVVFFSSIAGRIGNRGQADYGAANEILNKLARWLGARWPGRVVAIDWGPWATLGMATPEVQRQFAAKGIEIVPVDEGCRYFMDELSAGPRGDNEVVVAGGAALRAVSAIAAESG